MINALLTVAVATLMMFGLALFFVGFVLGPLLILAAGYALFAFAAGNR